MAETLTIRTASSTEVIQIASVGPQGPKGDKGDPGDVAGLPLSTLGDTLYRGAIQTERLPIGTNGQVLKVSGGIPAWGAESGAVSSVAGRTGAVTLAVADVADAVATSDARLSDARTPSSTLAHASTHYTGGTDAIAPNNIGAGWAQIASTQGITGDTVLVAWRNLRIGVGSVSTITANITLPFSGNQAGDTITLVAVSVGPPFSSTYTIRLAGQFDGGGNPVGYSNLATINALGQSFTFVSDGSASGWSLRAVDTHTHTGAQVNVGTTANLPLRTGTNGVVEAGAFGTAAASFCEGNDARLSDDRDPNLHAASHLPDGADEIFDQSLNTDDSPTFAELSVTNTGGDGVQLLVANDDGVFSNITSLSSESKSEARTSLGLGDAAVEDTTAFAASGSITSSGLTQATARILGRTTASTGAVEEIQIGSGLSLSAGELSATGGGGEVRSDFVSPYTYTGLADAGASESTASWLIRRSEFDAGGSFVATLTASAVEWDDRLTASYA
jgi:hypothetical protein